MVLMGDQVSSESGVTRPRVIIKAGGQELPTPQQVNIHLSRMAEAGVFSAVLPVADAISQWFDPAADATGDIEIDIFLGYVSPQSAEGTESFTQIFSGVADYIEYRPDRRVVSVRGRDWASSLIGHELSGMSFLNMTASEALKILADETGLESDIDPTEGLVGQFYQYEHKAHGLSGMHRFQTAWDFCVGMQREYGYDLWVNGKTLHFKIPDTTTPSLILDWVAPSSGSSFPTGPVTGLTLSRRFIYSRAASVSVSSWDARQKCVHSATYPAGTALDSCLYNFTAPVGTTQDQCATLARLRFKDLTAHERLIRMIVPPDLDILPRQRVCLQGTGTSFDSIVYVVDDMTFSYGAGGLTKSISLRVRDIEGDAA